VGHSLPARGRNPAGRPIRRVAGRVALCAAAALVSACAPPAAVVPSAPLTTAPVPGDGPHASTVMVCDAEGQEEISTLVGIRPTRVEKPTWTDHVYSCRYVYPDGAIVLSVHELPDALRTSQRAEELAAQRGNAGFQRGLGEGAFATSNGSIVARKDYTLLVVDIAGLPAAFGRPPVTPPDAAKLVAKAVLACWTGE
jgi:hypothetical protein